MIRPATSRKGQAHVAVRGAIRRCAARGCQAEAGFRPAAGIGLNTLKYYENWNEQDQTWSGAGASSILRICGDGERGLRRSHEHAGGDVGVKNADPNAQLMMGGIANGNAGVDYLRMLKFWSDEYRNGQVPIDVINVHIYSNSAGIQHSGTTTVGISPEVDDLKGRMAKIVDHRNRYMPGKEVWVSEFGYDCNQELDSAGAGLRPLLRAGGAGAVAGCARISRWRRRALTALSSSCCADDDANSTTTYASSGLVSSKPTGFMPKISWYYVYTLKNRLGRYTYAGEVNTGQCQRAGLQVRRRWEGEGLCRCGARPAITRRSAIISSRWMARQRRPRLCSWRPDQRERHRKQPADCRWQGDVQRQRAARPSCLLNNTDPDFESRSEDRHQSVHGDEGVRAWATPA